MQVVIQLEVVMAKNAKTEVKTFFEDFFSNFPLLNDAFPNFPVNYSVRFFSFCLILPLTLHNV